MKLLVRMVDDDGTIIGSQTETLIEPKEVEVRGIETVYRFEIEGHELNKEAFHKHFNELEDEEIGKDILTAMKESAEAVKNSPHYDFSCVTSLFREETDE